MDNFWSSMGGLVLPHMVKKMETPPTLKTSVVSSFHQAFFLDSNRHLRFIRFGWTPLNCLQIIKMFLPLSLEVCETWEVVPAPDCNKTRLSIRERNKNQRQQETNNRTKTSFWRLAGKHLVQQKRSPKRNWISFRMMKLWLDSTKYEMKFQSVVFELNHLTFRQKKKQ